MEREKIIAEYAAECARKLTDEDKENLMLHISYYSHHFGYGLYLRNNYPYEKDTDNGFIDRDYLSQIVYNEIISIIVPELKPFKENMDFLTCLENLTANYYLKYGKHFAADISPDDYFGKQKKHWLDRKDLEYEKYMALYKSEKKNYSRAIAEKLWKYNDFRETALKLDYSNEEISEIYEFCRSFLDEYEIFVPLEILFAKHRTVESPNAFWKNRRIMEYLFSEKIEHIEKLPSYVFEVKDIVLDIVSYRGVLLSLAPKFNGDFDVVIAAVKDYPGAIRYADKSLWDNYEIARTAAMHSEACIFLDEKPFEKYKDDDELVKLAIAANGANISGASERIRADYDMAVLALKNQSNIYPVSVYKSLSRELRCRKDIAFLELEAPCPSLDGFPESLLDDDEIAEYILSHNDLKWLISYMSKRIRKKYASDEQ